MILTIFQAKQINALARNIHGLQNESKRSCVRTFRPTFGDSAVEPPDGVLRPEILFSFVLELSIVFWRRAEWEVDDWELVGPVVPTVYKTWSSWTWNFDTQGMALLYVN